MAIRRDHELHDRRRTRNVGVLVAILAFVTMMFFVTIIKLGQGPGTVGNPSAQQGGAWGDAMRGAAVQQQESR